MRVQSTWYSIQSYTPSRYLTLQCTTAQPWAATALHGFRTGGPSHRGTPRNYEVAAATFPSEQEPTPLDYVVEVAFNAETMSAQVSSG